MADSVKKVPNNSKGRRRGKTPDFIDAQIARWRKKLAEEKITIWTPKPHPAHLKTLEYARKCKELNQAAREQKSFFGVEDDES